ncbi:flagellar hook-basal body protein [Liquorilactobacillus vini]|uniref:Flagellar basal-body rod protein n=1 Tax=Liquorilactobacillus vini DSM 20605 TaxID=1133569 RepID=A0A0A7RGW1_9LACO|nr:flagellar hook-basal body protein [Liquorilactobacillus vini]AJA34486.1 flagellar basal-body rod protein FlgF [Liquorilactobacillus vini DSM 20605]KRM88631.1 flagellar basal-body rod protein [Liquorilactobacillus vini DSM 20605]
MIRGLDTLYQSVNILGKRQENISANIANVETTGYQAKELFQSTYKEVQMHNYQGGGDNDQRVNYDGFTYGNYIAGSYLDSSKGALESTGRSTDFAINSDGYFTVRMNNGQIAYTRNGNFKLNDQNQYVTQEGYQVLSADGNPVTATTGTPDFGIVSFSDDRTLQSLGNVYYTSQTAGTQMTSPNVEQGYLEESNVSASDEMVSMIQTSREFEANQKALSATNQTLDKAVNYLGKI